MIRAALATLPAELLLNVIGRDTISLGRKYKSKWIGQLPTKIVITSNEVPNLRDASGVLPTRFIKLEFKQSFYGHEDIELRDKLSSELPGIANRCLAALRNLNERGRFIQPKAGKALEQAIENLTNPFAAFMNEKWERDDASEGPTMDIFYSSFKRWAEDNGRIDLCRSVPQNKLISYITAMDEWSWLSAPTARMARSEDIPDCEEGPRRRMTMANWCPADPVCAEPLPSLEPHQFGSEPHQPCLNRIDFRDSMNRIRVRSRSIFHYQIPYKLTAPVWFIRFMRFKEIRIRIKRIMRK